MKGRVAPRLAWSLWAGYFLLGGLGLLFKDLNASVTGPEVALGVVGIPLAPPSALLGYTTVGALVASRHPRNAIGWIFLAFGLGPAVYQFARQYGTYAIYTEPGSLPGGAWAAWLTTWITVVTFATGATFLILLFPNGRLLSRRWRPVAWLAGAMISIFVVGSALSRGELEGFPGVRNPAGVGTPELGELWWLFGAGLPALALASVASLVLRYRRSRGDERQQLKWFTFTVLVAVSFMVPTVAGFGFLPRGVREWLLPVVLLGPLALAPVAVGVAILRYRLYGIDLIINRTIVYGVLTAFVGVAYFGSVVLLQRVFSPLTGGSDLAIAGSTLGVAAVFRPARRRIQAFVDRRFYRRKYDAARTLEAFSARLREEIDLDSLSYELVAVVRETMQPAHVSLWLRAPVRAGR